MNKHAKYCYKMDIFLDGIFDCSTTEVKTIESAKKWYTKKNKAIDTKRLTFLPHYSAVN